MEVFSFGNGDFLFQIFSAVKGLMGDGSYSTLVRLSALLGFLFLMYSLLFTFNLSTFMAGFFKQYFVIVLLIYVLFIPKTSVVINDVIKNTNVTVNQVPYGIGLFAHFFTTIEKGITTIMETYYSIPSDLRYSKSGYAMSALFIDSMRSATLRDPYLLRTLNDYIVNCFFHDVLWGDKDLNANVIFSTNLLGDMAPVHSHNLYTRIYSSSNPMGEAKTCSDGYSSITSSIVAALNEAKNDLDKVLNINTSLIAPAVTILVLQSSMSINQILQQSITANMMGKAMAETAIYTGVSGDTIAYMTSMAEQQNRSSWLVSGELAKKYIPVLRQVLEAVVYGVFPILFVMMMTPFGLQALRMYITLLIWLLMWSPLFSILNLIVTTRLEGVLSPVYTKYTLGNLPFIYESTANIVAMAGYFAFLVPTLAFAIAKGSDYAIVSMASGIGSSASSMASGQASSVIGSVGTSMAATAGMMQAQEQFSNSWAYGVAAKQYYDTAHGVFLAQKGGAVADMARGAVEFSHQKAISANATKNAYTKEASNRGDNSEQGAYKVMGEQMLARAQLGIGELKGVIASADSGFSGNVVNMGETASKQRWEGLIGSIEGAGGTGQFLQNVRNMSAREQQQFMTEVDTYKQITGVQSDSQAAMAIGRASGMFQGVKTAGAEKYLQGVGVQAAHEAISQRETISTGQTQAQIKRMSYAGYQTDGLSGVLEGARNMSLGQESSMGGMTKDQLNKLMKSSGINYNFTSGGTASMSFNSDGKVMSMSARTDDGKNVSFDGGTIRESATKSGEELKQVADALRSAGKTNMAQGIESAISKGQAVTFDMNIDPSSGRIGSVSASSGGSVNSSDFRTDTKGWENIQKALSKGEFGSVNTNYNWSGQIGGVSMKGVRTDYGSGVSTISNATFSVGGATYSGSATLQGGEVVKLEGQSGRDFLRMDKNNNIFERRNEATNTNLSVSKDYAEIEKTIGSQKEADMYNRLLQNDGYGKHNLRVGDSLKVRTDQLGNISTLQATKGAQREFVNLEKSHTGKESIQSFDYSHMRGGVRTDNVISTMIQETGGKELATILSGGVSAVKEGSSILRFFKADVKVGQTSGGALKTPQSTTSTKPTLFGPDGKPLK